MSRISFNVAAKCDKAGRAQNQDNYWVCPDLSRFGAMTSDIGNDHDFELSKKGALLVVADGMGGMKSGEKASEYVIEGIKAHFANIPDTILSDDQAITDFIKAGIVKADNMVKDYAANHHESEGMGSTIVLLWLLGDKAYCGWVGDSRIYCYNPQNSLVRLSHDHSYVQSLVDDGKISEEEAFDHPDSNIITRSIGDSGETVKPETKVYPIHRRDVFLLCSDGLCGLLPDSEIETILADNSTSSADALRQLWTKADATGFDDNCTIEVACVTEGGITPSRKWAGYDEGRPKPVRKPAGKVEVSARKLGFWESNRQYIILLLCVLLIGGGIYWFFSRSDESGSSDNRDYTYEQTGDDDRLSSDNSRDDDRQGGNNSRRDDRRDERRDNRKPDNQQADGNRPAQQQTAEDNPANQQTDNTNQQTAEAINNANGSKTVSPEFRVLLNNTYASVNSIMATVNFIKRTSFIDQRQAMELNNFQANVNSLKKQPDVKYLEGEDKARYNTIIATGKSVSEILAKINKGGRRSNPPTDNHDGGGNGDGDGGSATAVVDPIYE